MGTCPLRGDAEPPRASESYRAREIAESFGSEAGRYDRTRPPYPSDMVDAILAASPGRRFLDVGMGTGISARPFQRQGCDVLGVDTDERMAELARARGLEVEIARFEEWDPAGRTFDAVIAGQAWHWVDPDVGASKAAGVLRPGGRIALFWNVMTFPATVAEGFAAIYRRVLPEFPFLQSAPPGGAGVVPPAVGHGRRRPPAAQDVQPAGAVVIPVVTGVHPGRLAGDRPDFRRAQPSAARDPGRLLAGIGQVIDAAGGRITVEYNAEVVTASRVVSG